MSDVGEVLGRFSRKQASVDEALRALVSHDGWYAPAAWAAEVFGATFDEACDWGGPPNVPPGRLWLFTSLDAGRTAMAHGARPGLYVGPLRGSTVFESLPAKLDLLEVNPGGPSALGWVLGGRNVGLGRGWGMAIALEQALDSGKGLAARLCGFPELLVLTTPTGAIATAVGAAGMKNPGLLFTAPDCRDATRKKLGAAAASLRDGGASAANLFKDVDALGVDGYVLNPSGVGPTRVFDREACRAIWEMAQPTGTR